MLEKATPAVRRRIVGALERVRAKPHSGKRLGGEMEGLFSLRIGVLRAAYEVDVEKKAVVVLATGPHGDIYKK